MLVLFLGVGFFTLLERKLLGASQLRLGVNKRGFKGLFQPLLDGVKLFTKERIQASKGEKLFYFIGPLLTLMIMLTR